MYCPNCGQPTPTEALRFCRQCGFRLDSVAQLIQTGGIPFNAPHQPGAAQPQAFPLPQGFSLVESPRRKGLKAGAKLLLTGLVLLPFFGFFAIEAVDSPFPLFIPFTLFLAGVARLIFARTLEENYPMPAPVLHPLAAVPQHPFTQPPAQPQTSLPPALPNTNDLYQPPSVVEPTTSLLKQPK